MELESKETKDKKEKDEIQVTISIEHENKLQKLVEKAASGFDLAKITRKQVLGHVIDAACTSFGDNDIQAIQRSCITDIVLLEMKLREIKRTGVMPEELKELLWKSSNLTPSPKKAKKSRQTEYSNAIYKDTEAA